MSSRRTMTSKGDEDNNEDKDKEIGISLGDKEDSPWLHTNKEDWCPPPTYMSTLAGHSRDV